MTEDCLHCKISVLVNQRLIESADPAAMVRLVARDVAQVLADIIAIHDEHAKQDKLWLSSQRFITEMLVEHRVRAAAAKDQGEPPTEEEPPQRLHS